MKLRPSRPQSRTSSVLPAKIFGPWFAAAGNHAGATLPTILDSTAAQLAELGSATVGETGGTPMAARIRPVWSGARLAAPAYTVKCWPGDNLAIHVAVAEAPAGYALVVDAAEVPERGYWGEVLTTAAEARSLRGLVIEGGVRDVSALETHRFPVFAAAIALRGATKAGPGQVGGAVEVGDVAVRPGDWVVGDADGVTVVPADALDAVLDAGRARAAREKDYFRQLREGRTTLELLNLDPGRIDRP